MTHLRYLIGVLGLGMMLLGGTPVRAEGIAQRADVQQYIDELVAEHNFERQALQALFADVSLRDDIIAKISRPAEKVWTWARYRKHLVDPRRITAGLAFWSEHEATLQRAQAEYGVDMAIIVAILGVETRYGDITGSYPVLDSLSTLGFDYPPRAKFFRKELTEFLLLAREEGKDPRQLQGSYAGAMGYGQFIPSSYRHYAVDFDADGLRDIWHNPVDAIGSIANYFARHKWRGDYPPAFAVQAPADVAGLNFDRGLKLNSSVAQLQQQGWPLDPLQLPGELAAKVFRVEGQQGVEYWLALHDFYVITRYNHSHLYALAIHHLATALRAGRD